MTITNLTPHAITLRAPDGVETTLPSEGVARVSARPGELTECGLPVPVAGPDEVGEVTGLPVPVEGVFFLVSGMVGGALRGTRADVLVPGTGPADGAIRNKKNHIIAVTRLKRV